MTLLSYLRPCLGALLHRGLALRLAWGPRTVASHCGLALGVLLKGLLRKQGHCDSGFVLGQDEEEDTC